MKPLNASRRTFLRQASALSLAGTAAPFALNLASIGAASASTPADYKALVCVFLTGANDAHNTVVPYDASGYATYAGVRGALAWTQPQLTPLAPTTPLPGGRQVALPAELAPLATLFDAGQCAVIANVGPLIVPTDRTSFNAKSVPLPPKLFSHNDQQSVWQASVPEGAKFGWGGRIGDLLASQNAAQIFTCNSLTGSAVFLSGQTVQPFQIDPTQGSIAFGALNANSLYGSAAGATALRNALTRPRTHLFESDLRNVNQRSIDSNTALAAALATAPALTTAFPANNALAAQLAMVAKIVSCETPGLHGLARRLRHALRAGHNTSHAADTARRRDRRVPEGNGRTERGAEGDALHRIGLRAHADSQRRRHRSRLGRPPLRRRGRRPGKAGCRQLSRPDRKRPGRRRQRPADSDHCLPLILPNIGNFATKDLGFMA